MTSIESRGFVIAVIMALVLSSLFFTFSVLIKFEQKLPKEIVIYLNPDEPVHEERKQQEASAQSASSLEEAIQDTEAETASEPPDASVKEEPAPSEPAPVVKQPEPKPQPVKTEAKKESAPKKTPAEKPKAQPAKTVTETPKQEVVPVIKKSVEDLMAEQNSVSKKTVSADYYDFGDDDDFPPVQNQPQVAKVQSSVSGVAGLGAAEQDKRETTVGQENVQNNQASEKTQNMLSGIKQKSFITSSGSSTSTSTLQVADSGDGKFNVKFSNGEVRKLISPKEPSIKINPDSVYGMGGKNEVTIYFTVLPNGSVPISFIDIRPASVFTDKIINDIKTQISQWTFSSGSSMAEADFKYTLVVK